MNGLKLQQVQLLGNKIKEQYLISRPLKQKKKILREDSLAPLPCKFKASLPSSSGRRARFLGGQKGVALQVQDARVGVGSNKRCRLDVDVRRSDVTALALSYRTFPLKKFNGMTMRQLTDITDTSLHQAPLYF
ncbi:hypothetical protein TNCV_542261 [Trichonephila clavipes]|nr:hypothetical protein TNCV_542261 [Trichonephila clavipes]